MVVSIASIVSINSSVSHAEVLRIASAVHSRRTLKGRDCRGERDGITGGEGKGRKGKRKVREICNEERKRPRK